MKKIKIVIDTNVVVSALRSKKGASYLLLYNIGEGKFVHAVSVPLILEYQRAIYKNKSEIKLGKRYIEDILDYICTCAEKHDIYYLWRPFLKDSNDDMVLELAVSANCKYIITFNKKDFKRIEEFGIRCLTPKEFLKNIGEIK